MSERRLRSRKKLKTVSGLALAALFLSSALYLARPYLTQTPRPDVHTASEDVTVLFTAEEGDITSVTIDPGNGAEYTLNVSGGSLSTADDPDMPIRDSVSSLVLSNLSLIRAEKTVIDTSKERTDPALFGFAPYACRAVITTAEHKLHTVRIGGRIQGGIPYYYFMIDDDPRIFAGSADMYSAFSVPRDMLAPVPAFRINTDIVDSVTLTGSCDFSMKYTDMGWQMTRPCSCPVSGTFSDGYLKNLSQLTFSRYITEADKADLEAFGLDEPTLTIDIALAESVVTAPVTDGSQVTVTVPASHLAVAVGGPYDELSRYALYDGKVLTISYFYIDALTVTDVSAAMLGVPFRAPIYSLSEVSVRCGETEKTYDLAFIEETDALGHYKYDENGEQLYELHVTSCGEAVDAEAFAGWFSRLQNMKMLSPAGSVPTDTEKGPAATVTLKSALHERVIELYEITSSRVLVTADGTQLCLTDDAVLTEIISMP